MKLKKYAFLILITSTGFDGFSSQDGCAIEKSGASKQGRQQEFKDLAKTMVELEKTQNTQDLTAIVKNTTSKYNEEFHLISDLEVDDGLVRQSSLKCLFDIVRTAIIKISQKTDQLGSENSSLILESLINIVAIHEKAKMTTSDLSPYKKFMLETPETLKSLLPSSLKVFFNKIAQDDEAIKAQLQEYEVRTQLTHTDKIIVKLEQKGVVKKNDITSMKIFTPQELGGGSKSSKIFFIQTKNGNSYVVKENQHFKGDFRAEEKLMDDLPAWRKVLDKYKKENSETNFPIIIDYHAAFEIEENGAPLYYTAMSKAKGENLGSLVEKMKFEEITEGEAVKIGSNIGTQMGQLSRAFFKENQSILILGDANPQNFLYDSKRQQLSLIDLGKTQEVLYGQNDNESREYINQESNMFKEIWLHFFPFHALTENHCVLNKTTKDIVKDEKEEYVREKKFRQEQFKDLGVEAFHSHRLRILASTAFYDNYKEQVNTLTPAGNWDKDEASFIKAVENFEGLYKKTIKDLFPENQEEILDYLFAPIKKTGMDANGYL